MHTSTPKSRFPSVAAELLAAEFDEWFRNLALSKGVAPTAFTGITRNGQQVIAILNGIRWTRSELAQMPAFIHWLCQKENISAYAFATMMLLGDGGTEVNIVADDGANIVQTLLPIVALADDKLSYAETKTYRWKSGEHWHPYTGLMTPESSSETHADSGDDAFFESMWAERRHNALWRERPDVS